jgi:hypothetical protein
MRSDPLPWIEHRMISEPQDNNTSRSGDDQRNVEEVVNKGPSGALALASTAVVLVLAMWLAFYFLVFLPRG